MTTLSATPLPQPLATALIAEDETLLAEALKAELAQAWPQLSVVASVGDGLAAVEQALAWQPDVLFLDIRMPGQNGLEAAAALARVWPEGPGHKPFPQLVFVTAYDQYAMAAFEVHAVDYLCKPVQAARLLQTVRRLQGNLALQQARADTASLQAMLASMRAVLDRPGPATAHLAAGLAPAPAPAPEMPTRLRWLQASRGSVLHMVSLDEVLYFEATDKYVQVTTASSSYLIRTPLKELLPRLDPADFWQVHRGAVVSVRAITSVQRDATGHLHLLLRDRPEHLRVSRAFAHQFKAM